MEKLDEKLLKYCGIYEKNKEYENPKQVLKMKKELEKLTGLKIEKVYVYGDGYWGKENKPNKHTHFCFLVDERLKTIDEVSDLVGQYVIEKNVGNILFWSLCQFEKRKQSKGEIDYYIANYGYLIYDSKKEVEIDERIKNTTYGSAIKYFNKNKRFYNSNLNDILMIHILEIYILKIGYYVELQDLTIEDLYQYIKNISDDKKVIKFLEKYINEKDLVVKRKMCDEFEDYVSTVKQEKIQFKLSTKPTMRIYEKKKAEFEKNGVLDIKTLTKEDEYIMYVLEEKHTYEIGKLYGVDSSYIARKNNSWNIRIREEIASSDDMNNAYQEIKDKLQYEDEKAFKALEQLKYQLNFEKCIDPILRFMNPGETYLLKEFWKFTNYEKSSYEVMLTGKTSGTWYRAAMATNFLKDNGLIEEVDFKKYKITSRGRSLATNQVYFGTREIDLRYILEELKKIKLLGINFILTDEYVRGEFIKSIKNIDDENDEEIEELLEIEENLNGDDEELEKTKKREQEIEKLEVPENIKGICKVEKYKKKIGNRQKVNTNKKSKTKNKVELSDKSKSKLGIEGEKYVYENLFLENSQLLQNLEINNKDIVEIIFYNIDYDFIEEDLSVGHGCDIELILKNKEHVYLEVKTSYDDLEYYSMTYNEFKCNMENQDRYYIIKLNRFKYINKDESKINITIIKNPYKLFMENIDILKTITFF